ncbi:MAG: hypothetical protein CBE47_01330 [Pelagibacteraceae bacterium TMED287]|jgi:hypothetical protein|nr:MAG: hypothetical protein CBE47_01330 [Pelagibacteraceae bacterium TMED287]|tara:strand:- start:6638 stop:7861 length:1224 start_codon:yes stop_codon:yes gene_type:complete
MFLLEDKQGKNLHLEHLEDEIINFGVGGGRGAINFLRSLRDMLSGSSRTSVNLTVKWDGAPAIFAGIDPSDNQFFVAKKGAFNIKPQLFKSIKDIDSELSGDLATKFRVAFEEFQKLGIKGVIQGDLMFTKSDIKKEKIDGQNFLTFQPNTIVYATPPESDLGRTINRANIGVVWHTTYTGKSLPEMKASFGVDISKLKKPSSIWMDDATYKDTSGRSTFTEKETQEITKQLSEAGKTFQKINVPLLNSFMRLQESIPLGSSLKTFINSFIREGSRINNPRKASMDYNNFFKSYMDKEILKMKSPAGKQKKTVFRDEYLRELKKHTKNVEQIFIFRNYLINAKLFILRKLNSIKQLTDTFIKTDKGFKVVNPEGYVAIDRVEGNAVKLVDRLEFSYNNFTAVKNWDK